MEKSRELESTKKPSVPRTLAARVATKQNLALVACLLLALTVRVWSLGFGLPYRYHVDEPPSVLTALRLGQGDFHITYPLLSPNLQEFLYLGLFSTLFLGYLATGRVSSPAEFAQQYQVDPTHFYLLARGLSVLASLATIALLYLLARRLRDARTALVACLFLGLCFLDVRHAHFAEVYPLLGLLVLGTTYFTLAYMERGRMRDLALAGIACGAALGLRYSVLQLVGTLFLGLFFRWRAGERERPLLALLVMLAATTGLGFVLGAPATVLNSANFFRNIGVLAGLSGAQEGLWGFQLTDMPTWQFYVAILEIAFGWPLVLMALSGLLLALWRHRAADILLLWFPVTYGLLLLSASAAGSAYARYLVPTLPFLAIFAADATTTLVRWLTRRWSPRAGAAVLAMVCILLVTVPAFRILLLDRLWQQTDTRSLAKEWIEANVPAGARIATQWHGPPLSTAGDPEPGSARTYDVVLLDPFSADESLYTLDHYRQTGFDYLVLSSFIYELARVDPEEDEWRRSFCGALDRQAELVAEFRPYGGEAEPSFFFEQMWGPITEMTELERPGPAIKIYRLKQ